MEVRNLHDIEVMANEPTVINLVNLVIATALRERASDIHSCPSSKHSVALPDRCFAARKTAAAQATPCRLVSRIKIMADMNIAERYMRRMAISRSIIAAGASIFAWERCPRFTAKESCSDCWKKTRKS